MVLENYAFLTSTADLMNPTLWQQTINTMFKHYQKCFPKNYNHQNQTIH
jgi:hypothetical protein